MKFITYFLPVFIVITMTAALPSCKALDGVPIRIGIQTPDADFGYSSKSGLVVSGRVPVIREK